MPSHRLFHRLNLYRALTLTSRTYAEPVEKAHAAAFLQVVQCDGNGCSRNQGRRRESLGEAGSVRYIRPSLQHDPLGTNQHKEVQDQGGSANLPESPAPKKRPEPYITLPGGGLPPMW